MKLRDKILASLLIIMLAMGNTGCDDFLEEEPQGLLDPNSFITSAENAESILLSAYANLRYHPDRTDYGLHYFRGIWHFSEIPSDNVTSVIRQFPVSDFTVDATYGVLDRTWEELYSVINRTNTLITRLPDNPNMSDEDKSLLLGEARFLRAYIYFNLVRLWGGVPLKLNETSGLTADQIDVPRSTDVQVYEQIEADLLFAEANAPDSHAGSGKGRGTKNSATALLAKVYLQWAGNPINDATKWQLAANKAAVVTGSLVPSYADVFAIANEGNDEILFEMEATSGFGGVWNPSQGSNLSRATSPANDDGSAIPGFRRGDRDFIPSLDLYNSFDPTDDRRNLVDFDFVIDGVNQTLQRPFFWKFYEPGSNRDSGINYPFLRYADVLLIWAEALNEVGYGDADAFAAVNQVRNRAGLPDLTAVEAPDQASFREAVISERRKELYMEQSRYYDLIRTGRAFSTLQDFAQNDEFTFNASNVTMDRLLLPIPQNEIDNNEGIGQEDQNPGY